MAPRFPLPFLPGLAGKVATALGAPNKEMARATPSSKGGETPGQLQTYRTEIYTYFTEPGPERLLYSAENWVRLKLTLQTAGPVAVGTRADLTPTLSGKGVLLDTDVPFEVYLSKGARFYVASGSVNRVTVTVEPIPWLEQLSGQISALGGALAQAAQSIVAGIVAGITSGLKGAGASAAAREAALPPAAKVAMPAIAPGPRLPPRLPSRPIGPRR